MYCKKCGQQIPNEAKFCKKCGYKIPECIQNDSQSDDRTKIEKTSRDLTDREKLYICFGMILLIIVAIIAIIFNKNKSLNLNKYITITTSGYDTVGVANIVFDYESLKTDCGLENSSKNTSEYEDGSYEEFMSGLSELINDANYDVGSHIDWTISKCEYLCNGDTIELKWECDNDYFKSKYGKKIKYSDILYKVDNLEKVTMINPFDGISIKVMEGYNESFLRLNNDNVDEIHSKLIFDFDNNNNVKVGDKIRIVVVSSRDDFIEKYGVSWNETSIEYEILDGDIESSEVSEKNRISDDNEENETGYLLRNITQLTDKPNYIKNLYEAAIEKSKNMKLTVEAGSGKVSIGNVSTIGLDFYPNGNENIGEITSKYYTGEDNFGVILNKVELNYLDSENDINDTWYVYYPFALQNFATVNNVDSYTVVEDYDISSTKNFEYDFGQVIIQQEGFNSFQEYVDSINIYLNRTDNNENVLPVQRNYDDKILIEQDSSNNQNTESIDEALICELAKKHYKMMNGQEPPIAVIDSRNGSELSIHLYEIMEYPDSPEENHAATWGWYYINMNTLKGTDFFGIDVDLNDVK